MSRNHKSDDDKTTTDGPSRDGDSPFIHGVSRPIISTISNHAALQTKVSNSK